MTTAISKRKFRMVLPKSFTSEPLFLFLKNVKLDNPWTIFGIACAVGFIDEVIVGALTGYWMSRPGVVGVFDVNNIPPLIMSLIVEPGMWAFYVGFPAALFNLFKTFENNRIFLTEQENIQAQVDALKKAEASWLLRIAAFPIAVAIAYYAMLIIGEYEPVPWFYLGWHYWVRFVRIVGSAYVTVYAVTWSLLAFFTLHRVFSTAKVKVNPYDGDNAGGLRFVGKFILDVSRLTLIVLPFLIAETLFAIRLGRGIIGQFNLWIEITALPLLLVLMVFLPLTACRRAMFAARDEFLAPLRDKISKYIKTTHAPDSISKPQLEELTALIDFQTKLRKDYPTWPFDMSMSQQIGLGFVLTFLPVILNIVYQISSPASHSIP
jgi:hypothetical protein